MMRRHPLLIGAAATPLLAFGLVSTPAAAAEGDLIVNGGFESGTSGWSCSAAETVSDPVHAGASALSGAASAWDNATCSQTVAVQPDTEYTLSGFVQGSYVYLGESVTGASTWTSASSYSELETIFTTGANQTTATVYVHGWYGQGSYLADDISLVGPQGEVSVPDAPTAVAAADVTDTAVTLSWTAPSGPVTEYTVLRDGQSVGTTSQTTFTDTALSAETDYVYTVTADNSAGSSSPSEALSVTTAPADSGGDGDNGGGDDGDGDNGSSTGPASELPEHLLTGYWQNFDNGATPLRLSDVPTSYDLIAVAFADAVRTDGAKVSFHVDEGLSDALGGYTEDDVIADIATLHERGQKVIISVGGELGRVVVASSSAADSFANSVIELIETYGFDGVDIDLENGLNATYMEQALRKIEQALPGAIITMAPQTIDMLSPSREYFSLALAIKDILTIVNTQYYNSGSMNGCDGGVYAQGDIDFITTQACTLLQGGLEPSQVGLGLPASPSGAGSGYVPTSMVNDALTCLAEGVACGDFTPETTWPGIRGAMTWSINWDADNGYAFANALSTQLDALP